MTLPLSSSLAELTDYWYSLFNNSLVALGAQAVYWGDQDKIPLSPAICVEPMTKQNNFNVAAAARRLDPEVGVAVLCYYSAISGSQENARESVQFAEAVESLIHTKRTMDGIVIHCYVSSVEAGYITKGGTLMRASRLVIEHKTQSLLPS